MTLNMTPARFGHIHPSSQYQMRPDSPFRRLSGFMDFKSGPVTVDEYASLGNHFQELGSVVTEYANRAVHLPEQDRSRAFRNLAGIVESMKGVRAKLPGIFNSLPKADQVHSVSVLVDALK